MRRELRTSVILAWAILLTFAAGCGPKQKAGGHDYTLRAQVIQPPDPKTGLYIYHEAIDDWVGRDGKVTGMDTMAMPFPVAPGVPLNGIEANDKVEVKLHVDYDAERPFEITQVRELPADTRLEFRAAKPPKNP